MWWITVQMIRILIVISKSLRLFQHTVYVYICILSIFKLFHEEIILQ